MLDRTKSFGDIRPDRRLESDQAMDLVSVSDISPLLSAAAARRDAAHGNLITYSRKVFIPLTRLCRDVCHYCTFATPPSAGQSPYLSLDRVLDIARAGEKAGCREALFTLGDKPELRYRAARDALAGLGTESTLSYLAEVAGHVLRETTLLPHVNPGVLTADDIRALRKVSVSQGIMLESLSRRLLERGGAHHGSPDKDPSLRLATIEAAGEQRVALTTGILIGIGETRKERIDALLALRELNDRYGHIQEIIIQNFQPKPSTRMASVVPPPLVEHLWTIAVARLLFEPSMNIQAPPNLSPNDVPALIGAGINDLGGISPVTIDHVNPEAPWPEIERLSVQIKASGKVLTERLALYPEFVRGAQTWVDGGLSRRLLHAVDGDGYPREDAWSPGKAEPIPAPRMPDADRRRSLSPLAPVIKDAEKGRRLDESEIVRLFRARGQDFDAVCAAADALREDIVGDAVTYVVTRNINYTNICGYRCQFCAFSKGRTADHLRGKPYLLSFDDIQKRVREAQSRGATEVCMQGGIHPDFNGETYAGICRAVKNSAPAIHIHAFSPLEIHQGAQTLGLPVDRYLANLRALGLGSLPGTAAEILDDEVRAVLCPDKIDTARWLEIMRAAHRAGLRSTATIMFGHIDRYDHWARHLLRIRDLQEETGGFTEFVPLPFVHMEAPIYLKGRARRGPSFRESVLMHAVARLVLHPLVPNIQTSWVKMGLDGATHCLNAGANDLGGTLMEESITRAAGASHGQEVTPDAMEELIRSIGRRPQQRTTLYAPCAPTASEVDR